jgi:hypothetical protein
MRGISLNEALHALVLPWAMEWEQNKATWPLMEEHVQLAAELICKSDLPNTCSQVKILLEDQPVFKERAPGRAPLLAQARAACRRFLDALRDASALLRPAGN